MARTMIVIVSRTRLYRVLLWAAQAAAIVALLVDRFGPGVGLTAWDIALADSITSSLILLGRQLKDPSTVTNPATPIAAPAPTGEVGPP